MTIPSAATKVHLDSSSDDPKQARTELADLVDKFNTLRGHLGTSGITSGSSVLGVGNGLESAGGNLRAKGDGSTIEVGAGGIAAKDGGITLAKLASQAGAGIPVLQADGTWTFLPIGAAEQVLTVDDGSPSSLNFTDPAGGGWQFVAEKTGSGNPAAVTFDSEIVNAGVNAVRFDISDVKPSTDDVLRVELKLASSGWTVSDAAGSLVRLGYMRQTNATVTHSVSSTNDYIPISANLNISNGTAERFNGRLDISGLLTQASRSALIEAKALWLDTASNYRLVIDAVLRADLTAENIVGVRFYWVGGATFDSASQIVLRGQAYAAS